MNLTGKEKLEVRDILGEPHQKGDLLDQTLDGLNNDQVELIRETLTEWENDKLSAGSLDTELKVSTSEKRMVYRRRVSNLINYQPAGNPWRFSLGRG